MFRMRLNSRSLARAGAAGMALGWAIAGWAGDTARQSVLLNPEDFRHYVDSLNRNDPEDVNGFIANAGAWEWMKSNIPFFSCPDGDVELTYYYRWWAYRKHLEKTPAGNSSVRAEYEQKAAKLRGLVQERLWDGEAGFFRCAGIGDSG